MAIQHDGWSIVAQYRKCGKNGCKKCESGVGHGPYFYGTKLVDGRRKSRYFGRQAPVGSQESIQVDHSTSLAGEVERLQRENARLNDIIVSLREQLDALSRPTQPVSDPAPIEAVDSHVPDEDMPVKIVATRSPKEPQRSEELTREQVEAIWHEEAQKCTAEPNVMQTAYISFMHALFPNTQDEHTRLKVGQNPRLPYVCPFRATRRGHQTFGNAVRLVRTAVPWVIEFSIKQKHRNQDHLRRDEVRMADHVRRYERMDTIELQALAEKMSAAVKSGNASGWTLSVLELEEQLGLALRVLQSRMKGGNSVNLEDAKHKNYTRFIDPESTGRPFSAPT